MTPDLWEAFLRESIKHEGRVPFFYLDVKNLVTIGVGSLADPWRPQIGSWELFHPDGRKATPAEVKADWDRVRARTDLSQRGGLAYASVARLRMKDAFIDRLTRETLDWKWAAMKRWCPDLDSLPYGAQLGMASMAWALGSAFNTKFPKFTKALLARDFLTCAKECDIRYATPSGGTIKHRNAMNRQLFEEAAAVETMGLDRKRLWYPGKPSAAEPSAAEHSAPVDCSGCPVHCCTGCSKHCP
jgi:hypothetical protein